MKNKVLLMILDGLGLGKEYPGNAYQLASTPHLDYLLGHCPHSQLLASGEAVGLPGGQMGNSEVGHMNIGAGRIVYQDLNRINRDIETGIFYRKQSLIEAIQKAKDRDKNLHLMGLLSSGGVHSHMEHLFAILELCHRENFNKVFVHAFLDGRDVLPHAGREDIQKLLDYLKDLGTGSLSTIVGRYFAMDRDKRWDRIELAYQAMTESQGIQTQDALDEIIKSYEAGITDEFIKPIVILDQENRPHPIEPEDLCLFFNFRPDRARQLTRAFTDREFDGFQRKKYLNVDFYTMTEYEPDLKVTVIYPKESYKNTLGEVLQDAGLKQLRIAETEKYAHVTFFFNGGREDPFDGETRILINSPKVATYDLKPEMSAYEVKDQVLAELEKGVHDLIVLNFANPDMVGHTGVLPAARQAIETVDACLGEIMEEIDKQGDYVLLVTADHGNSEYLIDEASNSPFTAHTTNPVFFIEYPKKNFTLKDGKLSDIAPTILDLMSIPQPEEMTGQSLILREES